MKLATPLALCIIGVSTAFADNVSFLNRTVLSKLTPEDYKIATDASVAALDAGADREWTNAKTGATGKTSIIETLDVNGHQGCRRAEITVTRGTESNHGRYVLCKRDSGKWAFYSVSK